MVDDATIDSPEPSFQKLEERKAEISSRLKEIEVKDCAPPKRKQKGKKMTFSGSEIGYVPKSDTHWDFLMKEMMWLGADFQAERKRQTSLAKKCATSIKQFHKTKEIRRLRELKNAELKRRKLGARIGREVRAWWTKIERVVSYKQKVEVDEDRKKEMNKQLVLLVQKTERYSESLAQKAESEDDNNESDEVGSLSSDGGISRLNTRNSHRMSIEEALASEGIRKSKARIIDYSRMRLDATHLYGESTASDSGSAASYTPESDTDDETTLREAMDHEMLQRKQHDPSCPGSDSFLPDPDELRKLREESIMAVEAVIARLKKEGPEPLLSPGKVVEVAGRQAKTAKHVHFKDPKEEKETGFYHPESSSLDTNALVDPGEDADDDADASDVEDYNGNNRIDSDDEFEATGNEIDDESTIAAEELLPKDISPEEEIDLLKRESEMSIEELRRRYAGLESIANHDAKDMKETITDNGAQSSKRPKRARTKRQVASSAEQEDEIRSPEELTPEFNGRDSTDSTETHGNDSQEDEEFKPSFKTDVDDETTIEAEEKLGRDISYHDELEILQKDNDIPIEKLRAMYMKMETEKGIAWRANDDGDVDHEGVRTDQKSSRIADFFAETTRSENEDTEDFEPGLKEAVDDETTIEAEEKLGREMSYEEEMKLLQDDSKISVDQLREMYASVLGVTEVGRSDMVIGGSESEVDREEFKPQVGDTLDDETTIEAEERLGREMTHEEEMAILKAESEIPVEQLRAMYSNLNNENTDTEQDLLVTEEQLSTKHFIGVSKEGEFDSEEYFDTDADSMDDETTIAVEEAMGREMSYEDEIELLKKENDIPLEELRALYGETKGKPSLNPTDMPKKDCADESDDSGVLKRKCNAYGEDGRRKRTKLTQSGTSPTDGVDALNALEASAERARQTLASRPFLLAGWVKLRRYQQVGLNWLVSLQSRRLNGILADEMGLGKTLQTISLLSYLASYKGIWGPHLVVVPTSVIINWETELKRFCPALKVLCYYGSAKRRKELRTGWTKTNWYHVVITSYQLAVQDAFAFKRKKWYYLILDEAQNIKNFQSQRWQTLINFNTQRRLLLTGTPLQNNLMELWSLLHFLMPYIFRSRKQFSYWFSNPMNSIIEGNTDRNNDVIKRLHGIIRPFVLRRLKKDVETQMPGKYEHIVKCQLSRRQMTLYEEFLSRSSTRQALKKGGNFMGMMNCLMQLRKVCNHPDLFEPRSIVTPFVLPGLLYKIPRCMYGIVHEDTDDNVLSASLKQPIWCGSSGLPGFKKALQHDFLATEQLKRLTTTHDSKTLMFIDKQSPEQCPDELLDLFAKVKAIRREREKSKLIFQNTINKRRCGAHAFAYPSTLLEGVNIETSVFQRRHPVELKKGKVILTPPSLLSLRKDDSVRSSEMEEILDKFVFCVPRAGGQAPRLDTGSADNPTMPRKNVEEMLLEPLEDRMKPYRRASARLSSFFPDKKLVQYDAGKLQTLAELLFKLKRGGHRALIFTQMSKMLDILEAFLNINGHTYLRLDGSTGVDRRQRFMDRFNNDTKIFCFILSTRSGGMGINLTGADTVIFYDSDWNPAMDAQAQDRAHRIGQTRDVHIYRLITEHTIEENILMKAKQKKNLDIMVMDQGKFDASQPRESDTESSGNVVKDVYTKGGLRAILGVRDDGEAVDDHGELTGNEKEYSNLSSEQMENAMAALEDEDDVKALRGAQKEAAEELKEFDENVELRRNSDDENEGIETGGPSAAKRPNKKLKSAHNKCEGEQQDDIKDNQSESELEKEFAAWQTTIGLDTSTIEASLSPMERYALNFREDIDPFYSVFYINEQRRKVESTEDEDDLDIEELEREKSIEERRAMDDGDLLGTRPRPEDLIRQRNQYRRERARLRAEKKRRQLTGENWSVKIDGLTQNPFWYNSDTGEATWDKPVVIVEIEANELAEQQGWIVAPIKPLVHIMEYLFPSPERQLCSLVCRQWKAAANAFQFVRHVYPVEMGALNRDATRRDYNHYCSIEEALSVSLPGDTIELADGHYWVKDPGLLFDKPLRLIGDEHNPSNVVIEMAGSIRWTGRGGFIEGVTFRRPKISSGKLPMDTMLVMANEGKVNIVNSVFDNDGSSGPVVAISGSGPKGIWQNTTIRNGGSHGLSIFGQLEIVLQECSIRGNNDHGILCCQESKVRIVECYVGRNVGIGLSIRDKSSAEIQRCIFDKNLGGVMSKAPGCSVSCSGNSAVVVQSPTKKIPGFRITNIEAEFAQRTISDQRISSVPALST